ncbi:MAG: NAD(P)H-dependent glycerol-3-phosphate dehydrogenase [Pseudomonadota bacterium]
MGGKVVVIGAGAWGTALAITAARAGNDVTLVARDDERADAMAEHRENKTYLPGVELPGGMRFSSKLTAAIDGDAVVLAVPAQATREIAPQIAPFLQPATPVVLTAKGFERDTGLRLSQVAAEYMPGMPLAVLSGPSFAADVGRGLPTAVTLACSDPMLAEEIALMLSVPTFRLYVSDDVVGAEMGGALKNVLAIACGIVEGRELGASARAALTTRGFAEMQRLAVAQGARSETLHGLSGLGDLLLTCSSPKSRNFAYGLALGAGQASDETILSEGRFTASAVMRKASEAGIEMPICAAVDAIIEEKMSIDEAINALLSRPLRSELG